MRVCSQCSAPHDRKARYCLDCHAAYMREWRKTHPLTPEQKFKDIARSYAGTYKRRGKLKPQACRKCADSNAEMHHPNYMRPLKVQWLCRPCHLELHQMTNVKHSRRKAA